MRLKALNFRLMIIMIELELKGFDFEKTFDVWQRFQRRAK